MESIENRFDKDADFFQKSPLPWRSQRSFRIQRLTECQHFHYTSVELGPIELRLIAVRFSSGESGKPLNCSLEVTSNDKTWPLERSFDDFANFDSQLHRCVFERRYSRLEELDLYNNLDQDECQKLLVAYCSRFSHLTGSIITCYPVLKFLELDCFGNHFEPAEQTAINTPAIAAAVVTKDFTPSESNQIRLRVGDILSIVEMNNRAQSEDNFWKAKLTIANRRKSENMENWKAPRYEIGYFPSDCVRLIDDKKLPSPLVSHRKSLRTAKAVSDVLRRKLRRRAPVFGTDLTEHLERSGRHVPLILERCCDAIEKMGIVTGMYRQCGIQSNIQRLRAKFDSGLDPDLMDFAQKDIYSVSSLLKQYFRQLPNPLFTFQSYAQILEAYETHGEKQIPRIRDALETMPMSHFRTAKYLMKHLSRLCEHTQLTDMTAKNLAIVWAPNLFRAPPTISGRDSHLLSGLNVHTSLCNLLITNANEIFGEDDTQTDVSLATSIMQDSTTTESSRLIAKSATVSDMRQESDWFWPRFLRGKSVDGFWKSGNSAAANPPSNASIAGTTVAPMPDIKWRRSHSTDASMHAAQRGSILDMVSRGMSELRDGVRSLRHRARSMRPVSRPPPSPRSTRARYSHISTPTEHNLFVNELDSKRNTMQDSITASTVSQCSADPLGPPSNAYISPAVARRESSLTEKLGESGVIKNDKKVVFKNIGNNDRHNCEVTVTVCDAPLHERSSPVEEWSSDSRDSPLLEMSRYDNVSPSGTLNRVQRELLPLAAKATIAMNENGVR